MKEILVSAGYRPFTTSELYALYLKRDVLVFPKAHVEKQFGYTFISIEGGPVYPFVKVTLQSVGYFRCGQVPEERTVNSEDLVDKWCFEDGTPCGVRM